MSISPRGPLSALILAALLGLPAVGAAAQGRTSEASTRAVQTGPSVFSRMWHLLQSLWDEEGMSIDPNGAHAAVKPGPHSVSGASGMLIDPNG
jgi:hypothetical protein